MRVRRATRADTAALAEIDQLTWSEETSPGAPPGGRFGVEGVLVAVDDDGRVAGYAKIQAPSHLASHAHVLAIHGLGVHPAHQRRGIGRALLQAAKAEAAARGARKLTLRVFADNAPALALYESAGFETEGVLRAEFLVAGRYVDDVLMAFELTPDPRPRTP